MPGFDLAQFIQAVGFPAGMAVYLIWILTKKVEQIRGEMAEVNTKLEIILHELEIREKARAKRSEGEK